MSKHDLHARPISHHTHHSIETHPTVITASLAIAHHPQTQARVSIKKIIRPLREMQEVIIVIAKDTHGPITGRAKATLTKWDYLNSGVWGSSLV